MQRVPQILRALTMEEPTRRRAWGRDRRFRNVVQMHPGASPGRNRQSRCSRGAGAVQTDAAPGPERPGQPVHVQPAGDPRRGGGRKPGQGSGVRERLPARSRRLTCDASPGDALHHGLHGGGGAQRNARLRLLPASAARAPWWSLPEVRPPGCPVGPARGAASASQQPRPAAGHAHYLLAQ